MAYKLNLLGEDSLAFQNYIKNNKVVPIKKPDKIALKNKTKPIAPKKPAATKALENNDIESIFSDNINQLDPKEELFFARPGIQKSLIRKFSCGRFPINEEAKLDLHGLTLAAAKTQLAKFLTKCQQQKIRHSMIIHGYGKHASNNQALLKSAVNCWLRQYPPTLAFASAKHHDGGIGSVYLLLKT